MSKARQLSATRSRGGNPTSPSRATEPDLQDQMGNAQLRDLLTHENTNQQELRLPAELRARLMADSELVLIAATTRNSKSLILTYIGTSIVVPEA